MLVRLTPKALVALGRPVPPTLPVPCDAGGACTRCGFHTDGRRHLCSPRGGAQLHAAPEQV